MSRWTENLDGLLGIDLLPSSPGRRIDDDFLRASRGARRLRGSIGYWTLPPTALGDGFCPLMTASAGGFLCVDLHLPTDLDHLLAMAKERARIWIHCQRPPPGTAGKTRNARAIPSHLLHTKVWAFDRGDEGEIWIGSHNGTARAYDGVNVEGSMALRLRTDSILWKRTIRQLNDWRGRCERFDPARIDVYRSWQRKRRPRTSAVLTVECRRKLPQLHGRRLTVFGGESRHLRDVPDPGRPLFLLVEDRTGAGTLHAVSLVDKGLLRGAASFAGGLSFDQRYHAFNEAAGRHPLLLPRRVPDPRRVEMAAYYITVHVERLLPGQVAKSAEDPVDIGGAALEARVLDPLAANLPQGPGGRSPVASAAGVPAVVPSIAATAGEVSPIRRMYIESTE